MLAIIAPASAQTPVEILESKTVAALRVKAAEADGVLAVAAIDLKSGRAFSVNGDTVLAQASVIKIPIIWRAMELVQGGVLNLDTSYALQPSEKVGGSGGLQKELEKGPVTLTLRDLLHRMIVDSDNTATNKIIALVGMDTVNCSMVSLGLPQTRLQRVMMDTAAAQAGRENLSTANEMAKLLSVIWRDELRGADSARHIVGLMKLVPGEIRKSVHDGPVAAKTGSLTGVRNEAAIVYLDRRPYAVVVLHSFMKTEESAIAAAVGIVQEHFRALARSNDFGNAVWP